MSKPSCKNYAASFVIYLVAVFLYQLFNSSNLSLKVISAVLLFGAIANFGYQLFKYYNQHDELQQRVVMKGTCVGAILTGIICLFYSFLENIVPTFKAEWAFYMLVIFSTLGQQFYIYKTS